MTTRLKLSRKLFFSLLRFSGIPFLIRYLFQKNRVTILYYHDILPEVADRHLSLLTKIYNIIPLRSFIDSISNGSFDKLPLWPLVITLDDGHKGNYKLLGIFEKYDIPVTIFLCSGIVGTNRHFWWKHCNAETLKKIKNRDRELFLRKLGFSDKKEYPNRHSISNSEINKMENIVDFQSHTVFHPILTNCTNARAKSEIFNSKIELEKRFSKKIYALAYPNGNYNKREINILRNSKFSCALTTLPGYNDNQTDPFQLKRLSIRDHSCDNELVVRASGLWAIIKSMTQLVY